MKNLQAIHYIMLACAAVAVGLPSLYDSMPVASLPYLHGLTAIMGLLVAVFGALSPSASAAPAAIVTPAVVAAPPAAPAPAPTAVPAPLSPVEVTELRAMLPKPPVAP